MRSSELSDGVPRVEGTEPLVTNATWGLTTPARQVWIRLDAIFIRDPGTPVHPNGAGLNMTGEVPGLLTHWVPEYRGGWAGRCTFSVHYADGRRPLVLRDQLIPAYALRPRHEEPTAANRNQDALGGHAK
jgi:hypothetical protein